MTDLDVLLDSINRLNNVPIPVAFIDEIGMPIRHVSRNLESLRNSIIAKIKEQEEKKDAESSDNLPEDGEESDPS